MEFNYLLLDVYYCSSDNGILKGCLLTYLLILTQLIFQFVVRYSLLYYMIQHVNTLQFASNSSFDICFQCVWKMAEQKFDDLSNLEHSYDNFTPSVLVQNVTPSFPQQPSAPPVFGMPPPPQYSPQVHYTVHSSIGEQLTQTQMAQDAAGHSRLRELANTMYQSSTCAIVLSCFVFWCCGWVLGLAAFILAGKSFHCLYHTS